MFNDVPVSNSPIAGESESSTQIGSSIGQSVALGLTKFTTIIPHGESFSVSEVLGQTHALFTGFPVEAQGESANSASVSGSAKILVKASGVSESISVVIGSAISRIKAVGLSAGEGLTNYVGTFGIFSLGESICQSVVNGVTSFTEDVLDFVSGTGVSSSVSISTGVSGSLNKALGLSVGINESSGVGKVIVRSHGVSQGDGLVIGQTKGQTNLIGIGLSLSIAESVGLTKRNSIKVLEGNSVKVPIPSYRVVYK